MLSQKVNSIKDYSLEELNKITCNAYAQMDIETQWTFWTGCMANHPRFGWIPVDEYFRILNINIP